MTVLLTGASGFIAAHVLDILVKKGFTIVATVRNQEKADWIKKLYPDAPIKIEFVEDIAKDGAFDQTFINNPEINYVLHTASPFYRNPKDPEAEILNPAIKGTTGILHSIKRHGPNVKHVVVTSSFAAILNSYKFPDAADYNEKSWNPITYEDSLNPAKTYTGSKKLAEKALWDFLESEKPSFTASTVNPVLVFGEILHKINSPDAINTSNKEVYKLLHSEAGSTESHRESRMTYVDVRDVAEAHVIAIEKPEEAAGKRWLCVNGSYDNQEILDIINRNFPELKGKIAVGQPYTEQEAKEAAANWGPRVDNSVTREQTGIKFKGLEQTVVETVKSLQELDKQWGTSV
uniref:ARAD1B02860p n=1 Tax=Blastobotrys adeninivorans TaxID=409370 RepID=A0A060T4V0_BLAAD